MKVHNQLDLPRDTSHWIVSGTDTFRLGSRKILSSLHDTPLINFGGNRANIEKTMRCIWGADKGYKLCQSDQEGAEAKIVAFLCKAGQYRTLFNHKIKVHSFVALQIFSEQFKKYFDPLKIDVALNTKIEELKLLDFWKELDTLIKDSDDWPSQERYYFIAKKIVHASSYGMGANKFRMAVLEESGGTIVLSKLDAETYLMMFHKLFPEIHNWHSRCYEEIKRTKELRNLFGYPFKFTGFIDDNNIREAYAFVPQSTVGTLTNIAVTEMQEYIEQNNKDWHILNNCHDSFLMECPDNPNDIKECASLMKQFLGKEFISPVDKVKFTMTSSCKVGYNWGNRVEIKHKDGTIEIKNEKGLRDYDDT